MYVENNDHIKYTCPEASYAIDIRKAYWGHIKQILYRTTRKVFVIWATENSVGVSRNPDTEDNIIGNGKPNQKRTNVMGGGFAKRCRNKLFVTITFFLPKKGEITPKHGPTATKLANAKLIIARLQTNLENGQQTYKQI